MKKSQWRDNLQGLVIASGIIWLLPTIFVFVLPFFIPQKGLEGLGVWSSMVTPLLPFIECGFMASGGLFVLYCLLHFLKWKKEGYVFNKPVLVFGVLSLIAILFFVNSFLHLFLS